MTRDSLGYKIDDSALFHGTYDPVKAREYYLRTRKLKGRRTGSSTPSPTPSSRSSRSPGGSGKPNRADTKSRRAQREAQKARLEARLDRLREVLEELVEAAKKRSGGDPNKKDGKDKAPETQADKADRNKDKKKDKPETAAEKKERAKKAKEEYEKEHPNSLSTDIEILQEQVADIQAKIKKALSDAADRRKKAGKNDEQSGSKNDNSDGQRGR